MSPVTVLLGSRESQGLGQALLSGSGAKALKLPTALLREQAGRADGSGVGLC